MSVPPQVQGQLENETPQENPFITHFQTSQHIIPLGHVILRLFDDLINLALLYGEVPKVVKNATNEHHQENFLFIGGKLTRTVKSIRSKLVVVIAPYGTVLQNVECDYLLVIGGKNITIENSNISTLFIYGTENTFFNNVTVVDTFICITNTLKFTGDYFYCDRNYITVKDFLPGKTSITRDAFYLLGIYGANLNNINPSMLDDFPNTYLCSSAYTNKIHAFKVSPNMINLRIVWLIWALWNVDHIDVNIPNSHFTLLESSTINSCPNYLRMARYVQERNIYYNYYYSEMQSINMHLSDTEINIYQTSTKKTNISSFDLIPVIFKDAHKKYLKTKYLIKL